MKTIQLILISLLVFISAITWVLSAQQYDTMMDAMMIFYNPTALSLFTVIWTAGMAAMMFPAIAPMILLYDRLIKTDNGTADENNEPSKQSEGGETRTSQFVVGIDDRAEQQKAKNNEKKKKTLSSTSFWSPYLVKMMLFVGSYLSVWALTGIIILIGWSIPMNYFFMESSIDNNQHLVETFEVFGIVLIISGLYQFSPLKTKCLGYCESPLSFFMRRWRSGTVGALKMGTFHGLYCLGCCWPYFLLMVALGWMNLLWMALFAAIIFGEKVWVKGGKWVARSAGVGFVILGVLAILGVAEIPGGMMIEEVSHEDDTSAMNKDGNGMNMMEMNRGNNGDNMKINMDIKDNDMK
jgi:predicted metal-binding membrane protein